MRVKLHKTVLTAAICLVLGGEHCTYLLHPIPAQYTGCG